MIYIGCHLSVTDGYEAMGKTMVEFGGNTFASSPVIHAAERQKKSPQTMLRPYASCLTGRNSALWLPTAAIP